MTLSNPIAAVPTPRKDWHGGVEQGAMEFWRFSGSGRTLCHYRLVSWQVMRRNADRAPANPQMDEAAYARASPFRTNYFP
jgi:hypothetical protein